MYIPTLDFDDIDFITSLLEETKANKKNMKKKTPEWYYFDDIEAVLNQYIKYLQQDNKEIIIGSC